MRKDERGQRRDLTGVQAGKEGRKRTRPRGWRMVWERQHEAGEEKREAPRKRVRGEDK